MQHTIDTPKYLKKTITETAWTQPILSANGTLGGNKFAVGINVTQHYINIWTCFNGQTDTGHITPDNGIYTPATVEITIYNPIPLNIKKFTLSQGSTNASGGLHAGTIYGSNDGANWVKVGTYSGLTAQGSTITEYINLPNNNAYYKYHKISNTEGGYNGVVVKEITLTATQKTETWTAGTPSDYDVIVPQVHSIDTPKYLKKTVTETAWTQPVATQSYNNDNTKVFSNIGGNTFAIQSANTHTVGTMPLYYAFDDNDSTNFNSANSTTQWLKIYHPQGLKISNISFTNNLNDFSGTIKACNDDLTYVQLASFSKNGQNKSINVNSNNFYKYYLMTYDDINPNQYGWHYTALNKFKIIATILAYKWVECTKAQYDQLPDDQRKTITDNHTIDTPKYLKKTVTETAWTQPILTSNGTLGGDSFAVSASSHQGTGTSYYPYCAFSGTNVWTSVWLGGNGQQNLTYTMYNPIAIKIKRIGIQNDSYSDYAPTSGEVWYSDDSENYIRDSVFTNTIITKNSLWYITVNTTTPHKYWQLRTLKNAKVAIAIGEFKLDVVTLTETWQAGTPNDYDLIK